MNQFEALEQEEQIIRYLFDNPYVQNTVLPHLDADYFDNDIVKNIIKNLIIYRDKYGKFPNPRTFYSLMKPGDTKDSFKKIMTMIVDDKDSDELHDFVTNFLKVKMTLSCLKGQVLAIQNGDTDKIMELLPKMEEAVTFSLSTDVGVDVENDLETILMNMQEHAGTIPSALQFINEKTAGKRVGGFHRNTISIFMGQAGVGKSLILCNEAAYSLRAGRKVLYVTLELSQEMISHRILANISDMKYDDIDIDIDNEMMLKSHCDDIRGKITNFKTKEGGSVLVKYIPSGSKPSTVDRLIDEVKNRHNYDVDLVLVDYIAEMKPDGSNNAVNRYESIGNITRQLRNIANKYGVALVSASQINRDGYDSKDVSMKNTSESAVLNHVADLLISATQDSILRTNNLLCHKIIKNRFGPKEDVFFSKIWWEYMRVKDATEDQIQSYTTSMVSAVDDNSNFNSKSSKVIELPILPEV